MSLDAYIVIICLIMVLGCLTVQNFGLLHNALFDTDDTFSKIADFAVDHYYALNGGATFFGAVGVWRAWKTKEDRDTAKQKKQHKENTNEIRLNNAIMGTIAACAERRQQNDERKRRALDAQRKKETRFTKPLSGMVMNFEDELFNATKLAHIMRPDRRRMISTPLKDLLTAMHTA
jgi:hypothetical protein